MLYRLFVYKSSAATGTAPAVGIVNVDDTTVKQLAGVFYSLD